MKLQTTNFAHNKKIKDKLKLFLPKVTWNVTKFIVQYGGTCSFYSRHSVDQNTPNYHSDLPTYDYKNNVLTKSSKNLSDFLCILMAWTTAGI